MEKLLVSTVVKPRSVSPTLAVRDAFIEAQARFIDKHKRRVSFTPKTSISATWDDDGDLILTLTEAVNEEDRSDPTTGS